MKILAWLYLIALCGCPASVWAEGEDEKPSVVPPPPSEVTDRFRSVAPEEIGDNTFKLVGRDWMIISAGDETKFNGMTASWGGFGVWRHPVAFILVYNTRYTYEFLERENYFTLSFFEEKYRPQLKLFGTKSGRNIDKIKKSGLTPLSLKPGMAYAEARMIVQCRKIYADRTRAECWFPKKGETSSPEDGAHKLYFGEIVGVWVRK